MMKESHLMEKTVDPMIPRPFVVRESREETHDTFTLTLAPPETNGAPAFEPGQFNMLYVFGVGEVPVSISGDPRQPEVLVHTVRAVGGVTRALQKLGPGDVIGVRGPFGSAWPVDKVKGKDVVIITGGIGLAPLRPAVYKILGQRERIGKFALLYGARTPKDILYQEQLEQWRSKLDLQVRVTVDNASQDWRGTVGVVTILIHKARFDPANTVAMVCGPEIMMRFTVQELIKEWMREQDIYVSMERNMKCAVGFCGHCQYGPNFICKDGPVFRFSDVRHLFGLREI